MAVKKFISLVNGALTEIKGIVTSTGAANEGDLVALNAQGKLDASVMPVGIGQNTVIVRTSEDLAAGGMVNIYKEQDLGDFVRRATATGNATLEPKQAHGFVKEAVSASGTATVYTTGNIVTGLSGLTAGKTVYLQTRAGTAGVTHVTGEGNIHQVLGKAVSDTSFIFEPEEPVKLA